VNPEFGTLDDLKHFVNAANEAGMYVILDWGANVECQVGSEDDQRAEYGSPQSAKLCST